MFLLALRSVRFAQLTGQAHGVFEICVVEYLCLIHPNKDLQNNPRLLGFYWRRGALNSYYDFTMIFYYNLRVRNVFTVSTQNPTIYSENLFTHLHILHI